MLKILIKLRCRLFGHKYPYRWESAIRYNPEGHAINLYKKIWCDRCGYVRSEDSIPIKSLEEAMK